MMTVIKNITEDEILINRMFSKDDFELLITKEG